MAEIEYPQRWLREHDAIPSEKGWIRPTTQEILKCQKGLEIEPSGVLKKVIWGDYVPNKGVPVLRIDADPVTLIADEFELTYTTDEEDYKPKEVKAWHKLGGSLDVTIDTDTYFNERRIINNVKNVVKDGDSLSYYLEVDGKQPVSRTIYFLHNYETPQIKEIVLSKTFNTFTIDSATKTGILKSSLFRIYDMKYLPNLDTFKLHIEYDGEAIFNASLSSGSKSDDLAYYFDLNGSGDAYNGEKLTISVEVEGVISNKVTLDIVIK